ncbi:MAG TPA: hypothetical protein VFT53_07370 [Candidatus Saccharimonadales bacterium]|nr:hypothetical protein [Candidatus Saccharimonadales bacterium]
MPITTFTSSRQFLGIATETIQGTAVTPATATIPFTKFEPEDKPVWLDDKALRGSMADLFGKQEGVIKTDFSLSGPVYGDTLPYLLANVFGDNSAQGQVGTATTTTGTNSAGSTTLTVTSGTGIATGNILNVGTTAPNQEIVKVSSGGGTTTLTLTSPLRYTYVAGQAVSVATAPFNRTYSLLNSGNGQPVSHTFIHYQGPPASTSARVYAGACLSELNLKYNAESNLFEYDAKGSCYPSAIAGVTPTSAPSAVQPVASWRGVLGIAGPASGGTKVVTITDGEFDFKRVLEPIFTVQGSQAPYFIQRGVMSVMGKISFVAADETPYLNMIQNTQPQIQFVLDNGVGGAGDVKVQVDLQKCAFTAAKYNASKTAVRYDVSFEGVANSTNAGGSGGLSPASVSVTNAVDITQYA